MAHNRLILNRYTPLGEAGAGGFATVQIAWDTRIQRKVAIKCIELDDLSGSFEQPRQHGRPAFAPEVDPLDAQATVSLGGLEGLSGDPAETQPLQDVQGLRDAQDAGAERATQVEPAVQGGGSAAFDEAATRALGGRGGNGADRDDYATAVRANLRVPGLDEARTAALLSDANIVAVYDFEVQGSTAYLIMEYVEGLTLTQLLERHGDALTLDAVAAVFSSVAHALEVAHENQVLHLDIKPDNILIDQKGRVKVTDFGLAKLAGAGGFGSAGGGTIGYMPLEQMRGELLDVRCDEWALASVTYEMLTGENPFLAHTLPQAQAAITDSELVLPSLCWDNLDDQANDVLFYALEPDREERYDTVADFAEEMEKFLGDAKQGQQELAALVRPPDSLEEDFGDSAEAGEARRQRRAERAPRAPLAQRIGALPRALAGRVVAAAGSACLAWVGLTNIPGIDSVTVVGVDDALLWGLVAVAAILGAILPSVGVLVAYLTVAAALIAQQSFAVGCVLVVAAGLWWWFIGRDGTASANIALAVPVAGAFGGAALAPLAAGAVQSPLKAAGSTAFSCLAAIVFASFGSGSLFGWDMLRHAHFTSMLLQRELLDLIMQPATWVVVAGCLVAAVVLSLLRLRPTQAKTVVGVVLAAAVLVAADCLHSGLASSYFGWTPSPAVFVSILLCAAVVGAAACLFPKQEEPFSEEELPESFTRYEHY